MKTLMGPGMGLSLCIGTGLGIGLFGRPGWGWQALGGAIIVAFAHIVVRSEHYQNYIASCQGREIKLESSFLQRFIIKGGKNRPSVIWYLVLCFLQNSVVIFVVAFAVFFLKGFLQ